MCIIETNRLLLRPFKASDLDDFYDYAKVPGVGERAGWRHHRSKQESLEVLNHFIESSEVFAIVLKETSKLIGSIGLHPRDKNPKILDLGYVLSKDYWGKGLMSEAVLNILDYAFNVLNLEALTCGHFKENKASQRIIRKAGFRFLKEGKYYSKNMNQEFDHLTYTLTKERFMFLKEDEILKKLPNDELWQLFPITLKDYNEAWVTWYEDMAKKIHNTLKDNILRISHIGSTAVKNLVAKPTIDILMEIDKKTNLDELKDSLIDLGFRYHYLPSSQEPYMMFTKGYTLKGYDERIYHLHIRYLGDWDELYFKDYLNDEEKVKVAYQNLKIELAKMFKHDRDRYTNSKTDFIKEASRKARLKYGFIYNPKN